MQRNLCPFEPRRPLARVQPGVWAKVRSVVRQNCAICRKSILPPLYNTRNGWAASRRVVAEQPAGIRQLSSGSSSLFCFKSVLAPSNATSPSLHPDLPSALDVFKIDPSVCLTMVNQRIYSNSTFTVKTIFMVFVAMVLNLLNFKSYRVTET